MKIYADFNGIEDDNPIVSTTSLNLTGYGTLASLSFHQITLEEGQCLEFSDHDGLYVHAEVYFDKERVSHNCSGWFARFKKENILENESLEYDFSTHLCFTCRKNIKAHLDTVGRQYNEACPFCETSVMRPFEKS